MTAVKTGADFWTFSMNDGKLVSLRFPGERTDGLCDENE
jgi:hypothetical protein